MNAKIEELYPIKRSIQNKNINISKFEGNQKFVIRGEKDRAVIVLDTNIVLPKIFSDIMIDNRTIFGNNEKIKDILDKLTNETNMILLTPTVINEVMKLWESQFDNKVYKKTFHKIKYRDLKPIYKKRIEKLINKYSSTRYFSELKITERNLNEIKSIYELYKDRLEAITAKKIFDLPEEVKISKLSHRLDGYMPEESDINLLAECMFIRQNLPDGFNRVILFTEDKDFTEFKSEVNTFLFVTIGSFDDILKVVCK